MPVRLVKAANSEFRRAGRIASMLAGDGRLRNVLCAKALTLPAAGPI